jgi:hypothetical protein
MSKIVVLQGHEPLAVRALGAISQTGRAAFLMKPSLALVVNSRRSNDLIGARRMLETHQMQVQINSTASPKSPTTGSDLGRDFAERPTLSG